MKVGLRPPSATPLSTRANGRRIPVLHDIGTLQDAWDAAGITIDVELHRSGSVARPVGRVKDVAVFLRRPAPSRIDARVREIEEERVGSWQTPPKSKRTRAAAPDNVLPFQPKVVTMRRVPFGRPRSAATGSDGRDI